MEWRLRCWSHFRPCSHYCTSKNLKTQQSPVILNYVFGNYRDVMNFRKLLLENVFWPHWNAKLAFLKFIQFEESFRKASFSWRISMDGTSNRRNKAAFSTFYSILWVLRLGRNKKQKLDCVNIDNHFYKSQTDCWNESQQIGSSNVFFSDQENIHRETHF